MIDRAEALLHENYAGLDYWACRRSMQYASRLVEKSNEIRQSLLNSSDIIDNTLSHKDLRFNKVAFYYIFC